MAKKKARRYSQVLYTPEQEAELKALYQKAVEVGRDPNSTPKDRIEALDAAQRLELRLMKEARARYRDSFSGDYARIMEALHHDIAATTKAEFANYVKFRHERADKVKATFLEQGQRDGKPAQEVQEEYNRVFAGDEQLMQRFARRNYTGYFHFLESYTAIYKDALKAAGLPLEEYAAALDAAAAAAYPKSPRIIYFKTRPRPRLEYEQVTLEEYIKRLGGQEVQEAQPQPIVEITPEVLEADDYLLQVQYKKPTELKTITDKLARLFYSLAAPQPSAPSLNGQRQMTPLRYEGEKSKVEITLFYDYVYNEDILKKFGLTKEFDDYDFFVMSTIDNLYEAGNVVVSLTKIYNEMGGDGSPTAKQLEPIYYSLLKGLTTTITINDAETQKAWKAGTGTYHEIVSPVIPVQLGNERFIANGKIANGFVKINGVSPFMQVAKPLGHITAWEKEILRLYSGRKTKRYYSVLRYLMIQIGWMRKGTRSRKITYADLYEHTGDKSTRAQQLTRDMMYRLLDEVFKPADYITAYKEVATPTPGVILTLSSKRLKGAEKKR